MYQVFAHIVLSGLTALLTGIVVRVFVLAKRRSAVCIFIAELKSITPIRVAALDTVGIKLFTRI